MAVTGAAPVDMRLVPVTQKATKTFIWKVHRHNIPSITSVFNIGLEADGELVGVAMVGIPKARMLMDGRTLEITRVAVVEGTKNANSMLYGACARAAKALGWGRISACLPRQRRSRFRASACGPGLHT